MLRPSSFLGRIRPSFSSTTTSASYPFFSPSHSHSPANKSNSPSNSRRYSFSSDHDPKPPGRKKATSSSNTATTPATGSSTPTTAPASPAAPAVNQAKNASRSSNPTPASAPALTSADSKESATTTSVATTTSSEQESHARPSPASNSSMRRLPIAPPVLISRDTLFRDMLFAEHRPLLLARTPDSLRRSPPSDLSLLRRHASITPQPRIPSSFADGALSAQRREGTDQQYMTDGTTGAGRPEDHDMYLSSGSVLISDWFEAFVPPPVPKPVTVAQFEAAGTAAEWSPLTQQQLRFLRPFDQEHQQQQQQQRQPDSSEQADPLEGSTEASAIVETIERAFGVSGLKVVKVHDVNVPGGLEEGGSRVRVFELNQAPRVNMGEEAEAEAEESEYEDSENLSAREQGQGIDMVLMDQKASAWGDWEDVLRRLGDKPREEHSGTNARDQEGSFSRVHVTADDGTEFIVTVVAGKVSVVKAADVGLDSVKRKRRKKMTKHKYKKRRKAQAALRRKLGKSG